MPRKKDLSGFKRVLNTLSAISASDLALQLEEDIRNGMKPKELREKYMTRVTARSILLALEGSEKSANIAIRDLSDRHEGRALEKKEITHHLEQLSDQEIEAMLLTEIDDLQNEKKNLN